jgi:hypothetical protein
MTKQEGWPAMLSWLRSAHGSLRSPQDAADTLTGATVADWIESASDTPRCLACGGEFADLAAVLAHARTCEKHELCLALRVLAGTQLQLADLQTEHTRALNALAAVTRNRDALAHDEAQALKMMAAEKARADAAIAAVKLAQRWMSGEPVGAEVMAWAKEHGALLGPTPGPVVDAEPPMMDCPRCGKEYKDFDGVGVVYCAPPDGCGFCRHVARSGHDGKCDYCGAYKEPTK